MNELGRALPAPGPVQAGWRLLGPELPGSGRVVLRLFCLPYAGGGSGVFRPWLHQLPAGVELRAAELPGREARIGMPPYRDLRQAVRDLARAGAPLLDRPYALFGHSMGALLAFELARLLRSAGLALPRVLLLSGRPAAHLPERHPPLHRLPDQKLLAALKRFNCRRLDVLACPELLALCLPMLRADFALCETYRHRPAAPLECPTLVLGGLADPLVSQSDLFAWREQTCGPFALKMFPGDHFFLHSCEAGVLAAIGEALFRRTRRPWT